MAQQEATNPPENPKIRPKPPVVLLIFILSGLALEEAIPLGASPIPTESLAAGSFIIACSVAIATLAALQMRKAGTTIMPGEAATALVTGGVFGRSRNPIYLSFILFLIGLGIATANPWMILLAPLLAFYLYRRAILREEAYLRQRFGAEYEAYKRKVRRWF